MELHLGYMSNQDLADWFGISVGSFKNTKTKKLEILRRFADFFIEKNKVYITDIYEPVYSKQSAYDIVERKFNDVWGDGEHLNVSKDVAEKIKSETGAPQKVNTIANRVGLVKTERFGKIGENGGGSTDMAIRYVPAKRLEGYEYPLPLDDQDKKVYHNLAKLYYGKVADRAPLAEQMVADGTWSKDQAYDFLLYNEDGSEPSYLGFKADFELYLMQRYPDQYSRFVRATETYKIEEKNEIDFL